MTLAFVQDNAITQYPIGSMEVRRRFPSTMFTLPMEGQDLSAFGVVTVESTSQPSIDRLTQKLEEGTPVLSDGSWVQVWNVVNLTTEEVEQVENTKASQVRIERDRKLAASDWTVLPDSPLSTSKKTEWKAYRTQLRDITAASGFPHTMEWPTEPS